jgi:hypothetical protein
MTFYNTSTATAAPSPEEFQELLLDSLKELRGAARDPHEGIIEIPRRHFQIVRGLWLGNLRELSTDRPPHEIGDLPLFGGVLFHESEVVEPGCTMLAFRGERILEAYISPHPPGWTPPIKPRLLRNIKRDTRGPGHPRRSKKRRKP